MSAERRVGPGVILVAALVLLALAPSAAPARTRWLCGPGVRQDPCRASLATTVVSPDGGRRVVRPRLARRPAIDCFYVYPTVSAQSTTSATLTADAAVRMAARAQASRFSQVCRVWAPLYRQVTLAGLFRFPEVLTALDVGYGDVRAAWRDYLAHHNRGRGVVLIGHSQGTGLLRRLMREQVDGRPTIRRRLVSAVLLGGNVKVAAGRALGGDFRRIPACRSTGQTGCVVAYSSYATPPPAGTFFGRDGSVFDVLFRGPRGNGFGVLCTNPARLAGGAGALHPAFLTGAAGGLVGSLPAVPGVRTPWISLPELYRARCRTATGTTWLSVGDVGRPADRRPRPAETLGPAWGLHLVDVNVAADDLVGLVRRQARAFSD